MYNLYTKNPKTKAIFRTQLHAIWYVDADEQYRVCRRPGLSGEGYVAVRTLQGMGELTAADGQNFTLKPNSLGLFPLEEISCYAARPGGWVFYWFEFSIPEGTADLPPQVMDISGIPEERAYMEHCCSGLGSRRGCEQFLAESLFNYLLAAWQERAAWPEGKHVSAQQILSILEKGRRERCPVVALAQEAGLCERSFREAVHRITGCSPKEYMEKMDMDAAMELLRTTDMSIAEIADSLYYTNPFYFSRVFRQYFGLAPSRVRTQFL